MINFDAEQLAREAYQHAKIDHRRTATTLYRLQTWHTTTKKNEDDRGGDYATVRLDASSDAEEESSIELGMFKLMRQLIQDGRKHNEKLVEGYGSIVQASTSTALFGLQLVEEMGRTRNQLSVEASQLQRAPTAADINHRVQTVADKLEKPATIIAAAVADRIRNNPGPSNPFDTTARPSANTQPGSFANAPPVRPSQADAQAFFESLSGEQKDAVRDLVNPDVFAAVVEVIMGPPEQWAGEVQDFKNILRQHAVGLRAILTPEQLLLALALLA
ncbi:MAG: hypothetical protein KUG77_07250 [Nannocystaceae bacterium]|nr:hypothetical protein [Nannocystaceae bacterium]